MTSTSEKLFKDRPEWNDITPIPQHDPNANPIAPIFYNEACKYSAFSCLIYKDATNYFRGVIQAQEMSERVLELTEAIIRMNPAHYSVWQYRFQTLLKIKTPLDEELELMDEFAEKHLKSYQVWHHRRLLVQRGALALSTVTNTGKTPATELAFISRALTADAKNYHTWAYRQWVLSFFNQPALWDGEMRYIDNMLEDDVRNNSVWHHRFFVVFASGVHVKDGEEIEDQDNVVRRELDYTKEKIALAPNNASAWNYLRGVLQHSGKPFSDLTEFVIPYAAPLSAEENRPERENDSVVDLENPRPSEGADLPCVQAIEFLADIHESSGGEQLSKAISLWKSLANEHDTIRKKYWEHRIRDAQLTRDS
ncbi:prenylyltransferase [Pyrrhoderma noxium]|uniref:Protein farnesyltransferase/geranylgeranyltransferase type-1 subunit alpha n=1 Tax=Pyrrhoderma noxium TaxID=2282107 RepID=A0A286U6H2_9AGAM|nr:prenylyltransferase [Pyrrhoderma noxium]